MLRWFSGNNSANVIFGSTDDDTMWGYGGNDELYGDIGEDWLYGGTGDDTLDGGADNDKLYGGDGRDYLSGDSGNDLLFGDADDDWLLGGAGNDRLDGGTGADIMAGGTGDDIYYVDNAGDAVVEWGATAGHDTVHASVNYTLAAGVEDLMVIGSATDGFGNDLANRIVGNAAANYLAGQAGDDTLFGNGGDDVLVGGDGNDTLNGGTGTDLMAGGTGNDTYYVDSTGDSVFEWSGQGRDTVVSSIDYELYPTIENLTLTGLASLTGTGNNLNNTIIGNSGHNTLDGGAGSDYIDGGWGVDTIYGGTDSDTLHGGAGPDRFMFLTAAETQSSIVEATPWGLFLTDYDYIDDFSEADGDKIDLSAIDANSLVAGDQMFRWIGNDNPFVPEWGAGQLRFNAGYVEGDLDGDMSADFRIRVDVPPAMHDTAFIL